MIECSLCGYWFTLTGIELHLVEDHRQEPFETWPDGRPVIIDTTLEPADFTDEGRP
jgi:hypothetical protein